MAIFSEKRELREICSSCVSNGSKLAIGGQNLNRNPVAAALTITSLKASSISLVGCNLSFASDLISYSGGVSQIQCGSINLEIGGLPPNLKYLCENNLVEIINFDHKTILSRLVAGQLGVDFIPVDTMRGTSMVDSGMSSHPDIFAEISDPWCGDQKALVVRSLRPDVCFVHVHCIDQFGNLYVAGVLSADDDLAKSSQNVIATCEEFLDKDIAMRRYGSPILSGAFVDHAVRWSGGGWPCGMPDMYEVDHEFLETYIESNVVQRASIVANLMRAIY